MSELYSGLVVGGPLDGQRMTRETPQVHVARPLAFLQPLSSAAMKDAMGTGSVPDTMERVTYVWHNVELRDPRSYRTVAQPSLWVPQDKDLEWAFKELHGAYTTIQRLRRVTELDGKASVTELRITKCRCPSENCTHFYVNPIMREMQGAGVDEEDAYMIAGALCLQFPHLFRMAQTSD